jgi:hypothetical protein
VKNIMIPQGLESASIAKWSIFRRSGADNGLLPRGAALSANVAGE